MDANSHQKKARLNLQIANAPIYKDGQMLPDVANPNWWLNFMASH